MTFSVTKLIVMLNAIMLSVAMLNVAMLRVVMLSVVAPYLQDFMLIVSIE
jgi:hypothetical protein